MNFSDYGIFGFDVSFYQDSNDTPQKIDFVQMKEYGASFVVIKAGQHNYADEDFVYNWQASKAAGIARSAYWFCDKDDDGVDQARKFWTLVENDQPEGMLFADFEHGSWITWEPLADFLAELKRLSGYPSERIGIYTGYYFWRENGPPAGTASNEWFKQFPLWLAWYDTPVENVLVPKPWIECLLWQTGTPAIGHDVGVESREIDYNKFNGDSEKFKFFMGAEPTEPGENMRVIKGTAVTTVNIRTAPQGALFNPPQYLRAGDRIEADRQDPVLPQWLHLTKINDVAVVGEKWASAGASEQYISWEWVDVPDPEPTPDIFPTETIVIMSDGSKWYGTFTRV